MKKGDKYIILRKIQPYAVYNSKGEKVSEIFNRKIDAKGYCDTLNANMNTNVFWVGEANKRIGTLPLPQIQGKEVVFEELNGIEIVDNLKDISGKSYVQPEDYGKHLRDKTIRQSGKVSKKANSDTKYVPHNEFDDNIKPEYQIANYEKAIFSRGTSEIAHLKDKVSKRSAKGKIMINGKPIRSTIRAVVMIESHDKSKLVKQASILAQSGLKDKKLYIALRKLSPDSNRVKRKQAIKKALCTS